MNDAARSQLSRLPTPEIRRLLSEAQADLEQLQKSFMQMRAGGCAMESLIEQAESDRQTLAALLRDRGE